MSHCDLKLNVFRCRDGYLVCPEFMFLPDHAIGTHAHVSPLLGTFVCGSFPERLCKQVRAAINDDFFAFIAYEEAVFGGLPGGIISRHSPPLGTSDRKR